MPPKTTPSPGPSGPLTPSPEPAIYEVLEVLPKGRLRIKDMRTGREGEAGLPRGGPRLTRRACVLARLGSTLELVHPAIKPPSVGARAAHFLERSPGFFRLATDWGAFGDDVTIDSFKEMLEGPDWLACEQGWLEGLTPLEAYKNLRLRESLAATLEDLDYYEGLTPRAKRSMYREARMRLGFEGRHDFVIEATLAHVRPAIWRRLVVPGTKTFAQLHKILQVLFGWEDYHLHAFNVRGVRIEPLDEQDSWSDGFVDTSLTGDERTCRLQAYLTPGLSFTYDYDFGDSWRVELVVREALPADPSLRPRCEGGERSGPPEDCGGVSGYLELVHVLAHPRSPRYAELRDWVGPRFAAEAFDLDAVNRKLARVFPASKRATSQA